MLPHREEEVEEEEGVLDTLDACLHPDLSNLIMPLTSQHYSHTGAAASTQLGGGRTGIVPGQ